MTPEDKSLLYRARAPLRMSFAGGGTDVPPYPERHGGLVLSATIDKYADVTLSLSSSPGVQVRSLDHDVTARLGLNERLDHDGNLDLIEAVVDRLPLDQGQGLELFLHCDAPPGTGLGSSSAIVVALLAVMKEWLRLPLTCYEIADLAYQIERIELGMKGGLQDQYASTFGGFNFIEFHANSVVVNTLRIPNAVINELQYCLLLCYTGQTHLSAGIMDAQILNYVNENPEVMAALARLKSITVAAKAALLGGRLTEFGALLHDDWEQKRKLAHEITTPRIDEMYDQARRAGALGGKLLGAGGGGYLLLFCPFARKHTIARAMTQLGGQLVPFAFEARGVQTWRVNGQV